MKKQILFFIALLCLLITSCKREEYAEPIEGTPVFKIQGTLDGQPFSLAAGVDGVRLNANTVQNSFGVYEFVSDFNRNGCDACEPLLRIKLNDEAMQEVGTAVSADILHVGTFHFATEETSSDYLTINFDLPNIPGANCHWYFGDSSESNEHDPAHTYTSPGTYSVTLNIDQGGGPDDEVIITQTILVGSEMLISMPFHIMDVNMNEWEFSYPNMLPPYLTVLNWEINGDSFTGNYQQLQTQAGDEVNVCLNYYNEITEAVGQYCVYFHADNGPGGCEDGFFYQWQPGNINLNNVELEYQNADGIMYTSITPLNGNPDHEFEITSVEEYPGSVDGVVGIDGHPAKKIVAHFNAILANDGDPGDTIQMQNMEVVFSFVY